MDRTQLLRIGVVAVAQELLSPERYDEARRAIETLPDALSPEAFWVGLGYLDAPSFAHVLDLLEGPPLDAPTQPYVDGPPPSLLRPPSSSRNRVLFDPYGGTDSGAMTRVVQLRDAVQIPAPPADRPTTSMGFEVEPTIARPSVKAPPPSTPEAAPMPPVLLPISTDPQRYRPERLLGTGGMGEVHESVDAVLGRRVALKRLRPEAREDNVAIAMLEREARVIGSLEHPNIIPVYDAGYLDETGPFYTMRLMERPSLEALLRKLRDGDPAASAEYTLGKLLRAFIQVCGAVDYAHSRRIIHCDLKPANILLGSFGEVLVVDWGMAHSPEESSAYQGGTPGYMAPEQFEGRSPDPRTDVYALGAILYEILTLRQAFAERPAGPLNQRRPVHPRSRAPERTIPDELADAALRAMELAPEARFPSASAFAAAIETFLEGTRERERREQRARELVEQGDLLADSYEELLESRPERVAEVNELHAGVAPWESSELKQALWDAEDRQTVLDALSIRSFQSAVSTYEQALDEVAGFEPALRGLARLYRAELRRAHERRDDFDRVYFEGLLKQVDPHAQGGARGSSLRLETVPEPAEIILGHVHEEGRRLVVSREESLGLTPLQVSDLSTGSYLLRLRRPGFIDLLCPILLRPGKELVMSIDLSGGVDPKPGEVFIPGGVALLGGDETNLRGRDLHEVDVPPFYIATFPVSFQEYFEFVAARYTIDPLDAPRYLPRNNDGSVYWVWTGSTLEPTSSLLRWSEDLEHLLSLPAFGVDISCALAYARWKSESTGRSYRLPTEDEWEKAARGTDGRRYPWGDRFDASFCKMRESRPEMPAPEPCGVFSPDISPYGVRDMAGGIAEWVLPTASAATGSLQQIASRGGAWCDWRVDCNLGARRAYFLEERSARVGFRLVREARGRG
jgi:serine/threonine-protein kinase